MVRAANRGRMLWENALGECSGRMLWESRQKSADRKTSTQSDCRAELQLERTGSRAWKQLSRRVASDATVPTLLTEDEVPSPSGEKFSLQTGSQHRPPVPAGLDGPAAALWKASCTRQAPPGPRRSKLAKFLQLRRRGCGVDDVRAAARPGWNVDASAGIAGRGRRSSWNAAAGRNEVRL